MAETLTKSMKGQDAEKAQEKKRRTDPAPMSMTALAVDSSSVSGLLGASAMDIPIERHATVLGDPRFSHSANNAQKARMVTDLQQNYGNAYVYRVVDSTQAKQTIDEPCDIYEEEADGVAEQIADIAKLVIQRLGDEKDSCQPRPDTMPTLRQEKAIARAFDYGSIEDDADVMDVPLDDLMDAPVAQKARMIKLLMEGYTPFWEEDRILILLNNAKKRGELSTLRPLLNWEDVADEIGSNRVRTVIGNLQTAINTLDESDILRVTATELKEASVEDKLRMLRPLISGYTSADEEDKILEIILSEGNSTRFESYVKEEFWVDVLSEIGWDRFQQIRPIPKVDVADIGWIAKIGIAIERSPKFLKEDVLAMWEFFGKWFIPIFIAAIAAATVVIFFPPAIPVWLTAFFAVLGPLLVFVGIELVVVEFIAGLWHAIRAKTDAELNESARHFAAGILAVLIELVALPIGKLLKLGAKIPWIRRFLEARRARLVRRAAAREVTREAKRRAKEMAKRGTKTTEEAVERGAVETAEEAAERGAAAAETAEEAAERGAAETAEEAAEREVKIKPGDEVVEPICIDPKDFERLLEGNNWETEIHKLLPRDQRLLEGGREWIVKEFKRRGWKCERTGRRGWEHDLDVSFEREEDAWEAIAWLKKEFGFETQHQVERLLHANFGFRNPRQIYAFEHLAGAAGADLREELLDLGIKVITKGQRELLKEELRFVERVGPGGAQRYIDRLYEQFLDKPNVELAREITRKSIAKNLANPEAYADAGTVYMFLGIRDGLEKVGRGFRFWERCNAFLEEWQRWAPRLEKELVEEMGAQGPRLSTSFRDRTKHAHRGLKAVDEAGFGVNKDLMNETKTITDSVKARQAYLNDRGKMMRLMDRLKLEEALNGVKVLKEIENLQKVLRGLPEIVMAAHRALSLVLVGKAASLGSKSRGPKS